MYLEKRRRQWYALHDIPADAQAALGRRRFVQSLQTEDRRIAGRRAAVLLVRWLSEIEQHRLPEGARSRVERDAAFWQQALKDSPPEHREVILSLVADEAQSMVERAADKKGVMDVRDPRYADLPEQADAERFYAIASGKLVRFQEHLDEYMATLGITAKAKDARKATIKRFAEAFPYVADVQRKEVQDWIRKRVADGWKYGTAKSALTGLRAYWTYLQSIELAQDGETPFDKIIIPRNGARNKGDDRRPFKGAHQGTCHFTAAIVGS